MADRAGGAAAEGDGVTDRLAAIGARANAATARLTTEPSPADLEEAANLIFGLLGRVRELESAQGGWQEFQCANTHRWRAEDQSRQCSVCGTSTFRAVLAGSADTRNAIHVAPSNADTQTRHIAGSADTKLEGAS